MKKLFLRNIKKGFATNSSSYHSTLILTNKEYDEFDFDEFDFDDWYDGEYETEEETYVTPSGDIIHVLCKYGYDY